MIKIPVIAPNCTGTPSYPEGTQQHAYIRKSYLQAIVPSPVKADGTPQPGCFLYVAGVSSAIACAISAQDVAELLDS